MATLTKRTCSFGAFTPGATPKYAGLVVTATGLDTCAAGGDQFVDDGQTFLMVSNTDATTVSVTVTSQKPSDEGITQNVVVDVAQNVVKIFGPFGTRFVDVNGYVQITYSAVTALKIAAIKLADQGRG